MKDANRNQIVVTLFENHYHFGVAALLNSISSAGFEGLFIIGYRGEKPHWAQQLTKLNENDYLFNEKIMINFKLINTDMHFGYYKPYILKELLDEHKFAKRIYYFDPDIVVNAPWHFYEEWVRAGVALCLDCCFPFVHRNHPWRKEWAKLAQLPVPNKCEFDFYVNSGFIGLERNDISIINLWIDLIKKYSKSGGDTSIFQKSGHRAFKGDQDLLNAALSTNSALNISLIGQEGMGFSQPNYLMDHAVDSVKPWAKNHLLHLIKTGQKPTFADSSYMKYANNPISPFKSMVFFLKKADLKMSSILGRLIG